ncbi:MAG: hypothetical protein ACJ71Z_08025 [Aeromicrobium sp.]
MRWDRLFGELEGHAEYARLEERDALVADLREGEWAERTWVDALAGSGAAVEISVRDVGVLAGHVRWATAHLIGLETASANYVISASAVQWLRGADRASGLRGDSVRAQLGWGPVLREAHDARDELTVTLAGGLTCAGSVAAVGGDFVRVRSAGGSERDIPTAAICAITLAH